MKAARVIPFFKKGNILDHSNDRLVPIWCILSKIIKKIVFEQIDCYISSHNVLCEFQYIFRKSHSTDLCLLYLTDYIRKEFDGGKLLLNGDVRTSKGIWHSGSLYTTDETESFGV